MGLLLVTVLSYYDDWVRPPIVLSTRSWDRTGLLLITPLSSYDNWGEASNSVVNQAGTDGTFTHHTTLKLWELGHVCHSVVNAYLTGKGGACSPAWNSLQWNDVVYIYRTVICEKMWLGHLLKKSGKLCESRTKPSSSPPPSYHFRQHWKACTT